MVNEKSKLLTDDRKRGHRGLLPPTASGIQPTMEIDQMRDPDSTRSVAYVPLLVGLALWLSATGLLVEDVWRTGHITTAHMLMPVLTASTAAAGIFAHHRLMDLRLVGAAMFAAVAILGSLLTVYSTLGRQADARDAKISTAIASNRTFELKREALSDAKRMHTLECGKRGPRCKEWEQRVDALTSEMSGMKVVSVDARADAIVRLAKLFGLDGVWVGQIVDALDAPSLPLYLELASLIFLAGAFPHSRPSRDNRVQTVEVVPVVDATTVQQTSMTRDDALADFRRLKHFGGQHLLAARWNVDRSTASRWLRAWEQDGLIERRREGKAKLALPAPRNPHDTAVS